MVRIAWRPVRVDLRLPGTRRAYAHKVAKRIAPRTAASKGSAIACRVRPAALHGVLVALAAVVSLPPFAVALHPRAGASICGFRVMDRGRPPLAASPSRGMEDVVEDPARPCARGVLAEIVAVVAIALLALACAIRARQMRATPRAQSRCAGVGGPTQGRRPNLGRGKRRRVEWPAAAARWVRFLNVAASRHGNEFAFRVRIIPWDALARVAV